MKADVEEVFLATLGCHSQPWMDSLQAQDLVLETTAPQSSAYEMLVFLTDGMVALSEIGLYPYVFNYYLAGKVLYCLSYLSGTRSAYIVEYSCIIIYLCTHVVVQHYIISCSGAA